MILPAEYAARMKRLLGADYDRYVEALARPPVRGITVNTDKISADEFARNFGFPIKSSGFSDDCFILTDDVKTGRSPFHHGGAAYVQEPGAMLPVIAADLRGDERVLDLCAAPGGKTVQAAKKAAFVLANDVDYGRARILAGNVERMGFGNVAVCSHYPDYLENAGINEFEHIRTCLRNLMKYIPSTIATYDTDFTDDILSTEWHESELDNDDLKNYKAKAEFYIRQHQDNPAIAKLRSNIPLNSEDVDELEDILWSQIGSRQDYEAAIGKKPLGEFVREIVGLDMKAAKEAFSQYLNDTSLDSRQIYFVNQIVEYIVHNGMMKDLSVLQEPPFNDYGSITSVFTDLTLWQGIKSVIDRINRNAAAA